MRLPEGMYCHILAEPPNVSEALEGFLPPDERARMATFGLEKRRREFGLGRLAVRTLLADALGTDPAMVPLRVAHDGAVEVAGSGWHVSLAHSGNRAVAAASSLGPIGVDLERIRPRHEALPRFLLHPDEIPLLETDDPDAMLILIWTLKEAVLKAMRTGFRASPRRLSVRMDAPAGEQAVIYVDGAPHWQARFERVEDFYLSVAFPATQ